MTRRSTKSALLSSVLALFLCITMLMGTTFAWFTDSVTSANNIIKSGNLDIELYFQAEGQTDWTKVTDQTNVFKTGTLWEPGHTEVVKLKAVNEGSLALKYQLGVNVASEVLSTNVYGEELKLSHFIKYGIVDGAQTYTRDEAVAAVDATATALEIAYGTDFIPLAAANDTDSDEKIVTMVVYMPTTVGNEANAKTGEPAPTINLGINVLATQMTAESDSFDDQYDANAPFSMWDGTVPAEMPESLVVDGTTQTIYVKDAAAFAYLSTLSAKWADFYTDGNGRTYSNYANAAGADYYYSSKWTVSLEADIDLDNHPIDPVVLVIGEATGASAFKGNNHIIRNINTTTGLFANNNRISYADLVLENVKATNGALTGSSNTSISNVTVKNATISGVDYVGGLVGYIYGNVTGCKVMNSSVIGVKEVGGLIGYIASTAGDGKVTANLVNNVTVYANNRAAGLVAQANVGVEVFYNIIDTVNVGAEDLTKYAAAAVVSNALAPENVYENTVINATVLDSLVVADDASELATALQNGGNIVLNTDAQFAAPIKNDAVIDLAGNTFEATGSYGLNNNADLTMSNGQYLASKTFGHVDVRPDTAEGSVVTFENVDFKATYKNKTFGTCTDRLLSVIEVTPSVAGAHVVAVFKNCTFDNAKVFFEGMSGKTGSFEAIFENCTFTALTSSAPIEVQNYIEGTITVKNCTFNLTCTTSTASAICVSPSSSTAVTINAENNTINAVAATPHTYDAAAGETEVDNIKVLGTPANIKFISAYENTTVNETGTVKTGIAQ